MPVKPDIICRFTGVGFASVSRVTSSQWIACSVLDKISFGLKPGGELQLETTICDEIRQCGEGVAGVLIGGNGIVMAGRSDQPGGHIAAHPVTL